jgi:hypothetical protein
MAYLGRNLPFYSFLGCNSIQYCPKNVTNIQMNAGLLIINRILIIKLHDVQSVVGFLQHIFSYLGSFFASVIDILSLFICLS